MLVVRRLNVSCLLVVALALGCGAAIAAATPSVTLKIFGDYSLDHVINGHYHAADLEAAIAAAQGQGAGSGYREFQSAVQEVYDRDVLGLHTGNGDGQTAQRQEEGSTLLPEPRGPGERDQPPWPFLAMTALAAALVVSGAGSSIYRRVRR